MSSTDYILKSTQNKMTATDKQPNSKYGFNCHFYKYLANFDVAVAEGPHRHQLRVLTDYAKSLNKTLACKVN